MSADPRTPCPVVTCDRSMPAGQVMCAHCWGNVPKDLRKKIGSTANSDATRRHREYVKQAVAAAQAVPR